LKVLQALDLSHVIDTRISQIPLRYLNYLDELDEVPACDPATQEFFNTFKAFCKVTAAQLHTTILLKRSVELGPNASDDDLRKLLHTVVPQGLSPADQDRSLELMKKKRFLTQQLERGFPAVLKEWRLSETTAKELLRQHCTDRAIDTLEEALKRVNRVKYTSSEEMANQTDEFRVMIYSCFVLTSKESFLRSA
jgi:hypothetical protein